MRNNHEIDYKIYGEELQFVEVELDPGETVIGEPGGFMMMDDGIEMQTNFGSGKKRVSFAAPYTGKIIPLDLQQLGGTIIAQKDAFLCAAKGVSIGIHFQRKLGVGIFGGEGFIMEKIEGDGMAFLHAGGYVVEKQLAPGELLRVDTGC